MTRVLTVVCAIIVATLAAGDEPAYVYRPLTAFNLYLYHGSIGIPAAVAFDSKHATRSYTLNYPR